VQSVAADGAVALEPDASEEVDGRRDVGVHCRLDAEQPESVEREDEEGLHEGGADATTLEVVVGPYADAADVAVAAGSTRMPAEPATTPEQLKISVRASVSRGSRPRMRMVHIVLPWGRLAACSSDYCAGNGEAMVERKESRAG
jgi:hypothetical protein